MSWSYMMKERVCWDHVDRHSPHALHSEFPSKPRLHNGVATVPQFVHDVVRPAVMAAP